MKNRRMDVERQMDFILSMRSQGATYKECQAALMKNGVKVSESTVRNWVVYGRAKPLVEYRPEDMEETEYLKVFDYCITNYRIMSTPPPAIDVP